MRAKLERVLAPVSRTIITGTVHASRQLRRQYDEAQNAKGNLVWDSPDILPRDAWLRRTWQECAWRDPGGTPVLLSRWQELALWQEAIEATTRDVLLNSEATASAAAKAWQLLHAWAAPDDSFFDESSTFEGSEDSRAFFVWMNRVRRRLRERGWITMAELSGHLRERLAAGAIKIAGPVALAGFDEIAPADRRLFDALGARELADAPCAGEAELAACRDPADEFTRAAVWARQKLEANFRARIGVVVPGLAGVAPVAERIFDDILHPAWGFGAGRRAFYLSGGARLGDAPMIAAALATLRLLTGVPREEAAMIWRSPFLAIDAAEGAQLGLELLRRRVAYASLRQDAVQRRFPEMAAEAALLPARMRPSQWSETLSRLLRLAGWPGRRPLTPAEQRTLESWKDLLSELARLDAVLDPLSRSGALSRLTRMAAASYAPSEDEEAPVQILDMEEAVGLRFDALWIAGLHAGAWPRPIAPSPFVPLAMQRTAGMPRSSAEAEIERARRVGKRLFASASEVVCSFAAQAGGGEQRASSLVIALPVLGSPSWTECPAADTAVWRVYASAPELDPRPVEANVPLPAHTLQPGGTQVLADQSACPFRAFAVHRLGAREMEDPDVGLSPLDRGSIVHRVLESLWKDLRSQARLQGLSFEDKEALIRSGVAGALAEWAVRYEPSRELEQFCKLEQRRLENLIRKWLEVESARRPFTVLHSEDARVVEVAGLKLEIRVDRLDRYEDGTHAILDYKTSDELSTDLWMGARPEAPQLPFYAVTSDVPVSEVAFGQIATRSVAWKGLRGDELEARLPHWAAAMKTLAGDFLQGRAEVDPDDAIRPCARCKLPALCRVKELGNEPPGDVRDE